ncbi:MAG: ATP-binding protein [Acidimicrobiales bacterium]
MIYERRLLSILATLLQEEPVVLVEGPRTVGKSTLLKELAKSTNAPLLDLDEPAVRAAVGDDPSSFISAGPPLYVDEYQKVPLILDSIKAYLNAHPNEDGFLLSGSARHESLPRTSQALTGRLHRIQMYPLAQCEIDGSDENFLKTVFDEPDRAFAPYTSTSTRTNYINRCLRGGFPMAVERTTAGQRNRWLDNYIRLTLERDVTELSKIRQATMLPRLLAVLAGQTAQVLNVKNVASKLEMDEKTAGSYVRLLEAVFLVYLLPGWGKTLSSRATALPKIHIIDSAVAARLLRLTPEKLAQNDPTALTEFGHLIESFVVGELIRQSTWLDNISTVGHWRTVDNDEVDLVIERDDGRVVAAKVKAGAILSPKDIKPMLKLREKCGQLFHEGIIFTTGGAGYTHPSGVRVVPIDRLWT